MISDISMLQDVPEQIRLPLISMSARQPLPAAIPVVMDAYLCHESILVPRPHIIKIAEQPYAIISALLGCRPLARRKPRLVLLCGEDECSLFHKAF
jgi:hypothetical protein